LSCEIKRWKLEFRYAENGIWNRYSEIAWTKSIQSLPHRIKSNLSSLNQIKLFLIESNQIPPYRIKSNPPSSNQTKTPHRIISKPLLPNHIKTSLTELCQNLPHRIISKPPSPNLIFNIFQNIFERAKVFSILFVFFIKFMV